MQPDRLNILLLNLNAFSQTGGVEKVSRILSKVGFEITSANKAGFRNLSLYDSGSDIRYCPESHYRAYSGNKLKFILHAVHAGSKADKLILTHINLAFVGLLIMLINPRIKVFLFAHGIEVWKKINTLKKLVIKKCHTILAVSNYTKNRLNSLYPELNNRIKVLNNCLDPFFVLPANFDKPEDILKRYNIASEEKVIVTLCRLSSSEKYKGYDTVISSLAGMETDNWKYLLMGKYDQSEFERITNLLKSYKLQDKVIITGFVSDDELTTHLMTGDLFIMPSTDEGFGIVFVEAAACGLPLIAGNTDGSADALLGGDLGLLLDPTDETAILQALNQQLASPAKKANIQAKCLSHFSYPIYKSKLKQLISE